MRRRYLGTMLCGAGITALLLAAQDPQDANGWEQLGLAQHGKGQYREAASSFRKALELGYPAVGKYNLACALARVGETAQAIDVLTELVNSGSAPLPLATDADLASLRNEPRFQALMLRVREGTEPCLHPDHFPEFRQLDFWVGNWDVFDPHGTKVGESHVDLILKNCVVFENWTGLSGGSGKSFNKYDSLSGKWEQFWVSDSGVTTYFTGEAVGGEMRYAHEHKLKDGRTLMRRLTFSNLPEGKVRQFSERSLDGGKTWYTEYDFTYVPRKG